MRKCIFLFLCLLSFSYAQTEYVKTFYIADLAVRPAQILLSPNYLTLIEIEGQIEEWASGQAGLFDAVQTGNRLLLTTGERGGETDLVIDAGGQPILLHLSVDADDAKTRRYIIKKQRQADSFATPLAGIIPPAERIASTRLPSPPMPAPVPSPQSANVNFGRLELQNSGFNTEGGYTVFFTYTNTGNTPISFVPSMVQAYQNTTALTIIDVRKTPLRNIVEAGQTQTGTIFVSGASAGQVTIQWPVMSISGAGSHNYTLTGVVNAE